MIRRLLAVSLPVVVAGLLAPACERHPEPSAARWSVGEILSGGETAGFARADSPRAFVFPDDHGPHPRFRAEWWYATGNLAAAGGERFGFQLTFFRSALAPTGGEGPSPWRSRQVHMAHFGLTDVSRKAFRWSERFGRAANGLAGARAEPLAVWHDDWRLESADPDDRRAVPALRLRAGMEGARIDLLAGPGKPPVLQGVDGLSQKGGEVGNASYYYSLTRLPVEGTVWAGGREVAVTGTMWLDREWSTSALEPGQAGWDWFALQMDDDTELMYYGLRRDDGAADPRSRGSLVAPDGTKTELLPGDVRLEVLDTWESPRGGTYPARWRLRSERHGIDLEVVPLVADQELDASIRYWEGAVRAAGTRGGREVTGHGYVELTGYAE